jgi:hypothetical protein
MTEEPKSPPWRNPYVIAFVVGALLVTLATPLFRKVAPPPEVTGQLPPFSLTRDGAAFGPADLAGRVALVGLVTAQSPDASRDVETAYETLRPQFATARCDVQLIVLHLDGAPAGAPREGRIDLHGEQACAVARAAFAEPGASDCESALRAARHGRLALLDATGQVRGVHGATPASLYETFERTLRACDLAD